MAIKPLKLKRYLSEDEAAQLLSLLIDEKVSTEDMAQFALEGIVPAYMQFSPSDRKTYPEGVFTLADDENFPEHDAKRYAMQEWLAVIPYPLPDHGWIEDSSGARWKVLAGRADDGVDEVTPAHYVRIYSPKEICQAAQLMNDPNACPEWPAIHHSHGQTWSFLTEDNSPAEPTYILSPFVEHRQYIPTAHDEPHISASEAPVNWRMIVAGLHKLLEPHWPKQHQISDAIADFKLPGAGKRNVDDALSKANEALTGHGQPKRRRKVVS